MKNTITHLLVTLTAFTSVHSQSITESDWQVAFNDKVLKGKLEVTLSTGRADIITSTYAIEVDKASKYKEGLEQAKRYAKASKKKPGLALYLDGEQLGQNYINIAKKECEALGIKFWLINEHVSTNDLIKQKGFTLTRQPLRPTQPKAALTHWITSSSGVRHNRSCRWFSNSKGRLARASEGRACKQCGG